MRLIRNIPVLFLGACLSLSLNAAPVEMSAGEMHFKSMQYNQQGIVKITGPEGFRLEYKLSEGQNRLPLYSMGLKQDGHYSYEVLLITIQGQETVTDPANGRENVVRNKVSSEKLFGNFRLQDGNFVASSGEEDGNDFKRGEGVEHEH